MREQSASHALFDRAQRVIPGGVDSPVRAFGSVGGEPFFVADGAGAYLTDVDGNRYIDYVQSWGASILGHAHRAVIDAICLAAAKGTSYGAPTEGEVRLAEAIVARVQGVEMARLVSSGTEAAMTAIRLARGATGRDRIVKFAGCYHGHSDALLAAGGSGVATLGLSGSAGVPAGSVAETLVVEYNALPDLRDCAAVIVEPVAANMGLVLPEEGFLAALRRRCDEAGTLLIFDEVITGFRLAYGGAAAHFGVTPDLYCLGKVIGGGLPLGALAGRAALMDQLAPTGPVYQAGTLSGNPLATAAGLAVLAELEHSSYALLETRVERLVSGMALAFSKAGLDVQLPRVGTLAGVFFSSDPVRNYDDAKRAASNGRYVALFNALLARGVYFPPSPYEILFVSLAHDEAVIDSTLESLDRALEEIA
jgi:glutamate-1-semialdehyde 2,1-aminomutase